MQLQLGASSLKPRLTFGALFPLPPKVSLGSRIWGASCYYVCDAMSGLSALSGVSLDICSANIKIY